MNRASVSCRTAKSSLTCVYFFFKGTREVPRKKKGEIEVFVAKFVKWRNPISDLHRSIYYKGESSGAIKGLGGAGGGTQHSLGFHRGRKFFTFLG